MRGTCLYLSVVELIQDATRNPVLIPPMSHDPLTKCRLQTHAAILQEEPELILKKQSALDQDEQKMKEFYEDAEVQVDE